MKKISAIFGILLITSSAFATEIENAINPTTRDQASIVLQCLFSSISTKLKSINRKVFSDMIADLDSYDPAIRARGRAKSLEIDSRDRNGVGYEISKEYGDLLTKKDQMVDSTELGSTYDTIMKYFPEFASSCNYASIAPSAD